MLVPGAAWGVRRRYRLRTRVRGECQALSLQRRPNAGLPAHPMRASLRPLPAPTPFASPIHLFQVFTLYTKWSLFNITGRLL